MHLRSSVWQGVVAALAVAGSVGMTSGGVVGAAAPGRPADLTVIGFGVVNLPPPKPSPAQIVLNLVVHATKPQAALRVIDADLGSLRTRLGQLGLRGQAVDLQMPPQLNYQASQSLAPAKCRALRKLKPGYQCPEPGYSANASLQVTFPSLSSLARTLTRTNIGTARGVSNFYINEGGDETQEPAASALALGYRAALANAKQTAEAIARADGRALGSTLSVAEGEVAASACGPMGGCGQPDGINPPSIGPNQELVAVTVTYAIAP